MDLTNLKSMWKFHIIMGAVILKKKRAIARS